MHHVDCGCVLRNVQDEAYRRLALKQFLTDLEVE